MPEGLPKKHFSSGAPLELCEPPWTKGPPILLIDDMKLRLLFTQMWSVDSLSLRREDRK